MAKKETFRHYGYFEGEYAKKIYDKHADEIIAIINGNPEFHLQEGNIDTDIDNPACDCMFGYEMSTNEDYLIRYERGNSNDEDWFIDVFKRKIVDVIETPNNANDGVIEYCPHCDTEVTLTDEFKVQICPECGKYIVPCNLCPLLVENKCRGNCPLDALARKMNEKNYGIEMSVASFVSTFNSSTEKQWERGFILTIFNDDDSIDIVLRIFYIKNLDTICFMNERDSDKGWFMKEPKRLCIDYLESVFDVLDISNNKLFVKVLE